MGYEGGRRGRRDAKTDRERETLVIDIGGILVVQHVIKGGYFAIGIRNLLGVY